MSLRLLIAHSLPGQRGTTTVLYSGPSGAELNAARAAAPATVASFSIINNPLAIRKSNPAYDPAAQAQAPGSDAATMKIEIPTDLKGLKKDELVSAAAAAIARIKVLEETLADLHSKQTQQQEQKPASEDPAEQQS